MPEVGLEPTWTQGPLDFESSASTDFTTPAKVVYFSTFSVWESSAKWAHARDDCAFNDLRRQDPSCDLMIVDYVR